MICKKGIPYSSDVPLPLRPGDIVYEVSPYDFYEIHEIKIDGVAVYPDRCCVIRDIDVYPIVKDCEPSEIYDVYFRTRADAESWKSKHLPGSTYNIRDCDKQDFPGLFLPVNRDWKKINVNITTKNGMDK